MAGSHPKPQHAYHLVDPSPWPLVTSVSVFVLALGFLLVLKKTLIGGLALGPYVFGAGLLMVLYCMASWWVDIIREAEYEGHHTPVVQKSHRYGMLLFIASEVMFFVAWFWAFFDSSLMVANPLQEARLAFTGGHWPPQGTQVLDPWHLPLLNTLILLTSGTTVTWAHHALLENNRRGFKQGLLLTILLGLFFTAVQAWEYVHAPFAFKGSIYGATFFMATGFHGAHVIIGTLFLGVCLIRAARGQFTPKHHLGFEFAAWYWHFVDVVWLFLFSSIYIWGSWGALMEK